MLKISHLVNLDLLERLWPNVQLLSHGCILCKYERVKSSPSQQAYKEKKDSMYALLHHWNRIYAHFLEQYCYLLAFIIVGSIPNTL